MNNLILPRDPDERYYPYVHLNAETGNCEISGESFMEGPDKFYGQVLNWFYDYIEQINKPIILNIKLKYYNTSSSKYLLEILRLLKTHREKNKETNVNWYCKGEDEDMVDELEEIQKESGFKFNIVIE